MYSNMNNSLTHVRVEMAAAELVSKPWARKSLVWEYFGFEGDEKAKPINEDRAI